MKIYEPLCLPPLSHPLPWAYDWIFLRSVEWSNVALFPLHYVQYGFKTVELAVLDVDRK